MWRKPTEEDIVATLDREEIVAFRNGEFETDPVSALLDRVASYVRGYLTTNGNIRLSPVEHEIPEATISPAMDYLAVDILKRLSLPVSEDRREARKEAISYFDKIASGKLTVESYEAGDDRQTGGPAVEVVSVSRIRCDNIEGF